MTKANKYTMVEIEHDDALAAAQNKAVMGGGDDDDDDSGVASAPVLPCSLDDETRVFVEKIFDEDMFKEVMSSFKLDPKKLPLGALSVKQLDRGVAAMSAAGYEERVERAEADGAVVADDRLLPVRPVPRAATSTATRALLLRACAPRRRRAPRRRAGAASRPARSCRRPPWPRRPRRRPARPRPRPAASPPHMSCSRSLASRALLTRSGGRAR